MTREEYSEMCKDKITEGLVSALADAQQEFGHNSEQYHAAFQDLWESRIPEATDSQIVAVMDTAQPHTQMTNGNRGMAWLYDRLMLERTRRDTIPGPHRTEGNILEDIKASLRRPRRIATIEEFNNCEDLSA